MSNPPKAKGTAFESEVLRELRRVWPDADRAKTNNESCDFTGVGGWVIEAKHRKAWRLFDWIARIRKVGADRPWAIVAAAGDRRTTQGASVGTVVIMDFAQWVELLISAEGDQ